MSREKGFTLIEVLVVAGITAFLSSLLIWNFSKSKINLDHSMNIMVADIRLAQEKTVSSTKYNSAYRCGYGIRYTTTSEYRMYAGPDSSLGTCGTQPNGRNYSAADGDIDITTFPLRDSPSVRLSGAFPDIFFEPPNPATFINNSALLNTAPGKIQLISPNAKCGVNPSSCRIICVYTSGRIDTGIGEVCP